MFKKSKRKIVAVILSVLVVLLFGTLCMIYAVSYAEMTNENRRMLRRYMEDYTLSEPAAGDDQAGIRPKDGRGKEPPMLELSTFYSVAVSDDGDILRVDTAQLSTYTQDELTALAEEIIKDGKSEGKKSNLIYQTADKGTYTLVAFLDNTFMMESASTLMSYTLIFGSIALVLMFFLARYLANRIVSPLEESYQRQKRFISDAGHELKTPVAVINANVELLSREIGENQWLSNIQYENERMSALIIQLLDLARTEQAKPQMESVDLSRLVWGEALPFETVAYESGLTLNNTISDDVYVHGNSVQLRQLTSILLDNAIRHSKSGKNVDLILKKGKNNAVLSVINDGEEILPEQKKHLFERFYRTDTARSEEGNHYGLGLAIAKAIAQTHKGNIDVRCSEGKVMFTVKIPLLK